MTSVLLQLWLKNFIKVNLKLPLKSLSSNTSYANKYYTIVSVHLSLFENRHFRDDIASLSLQDIPIPTLKEIFEAMKGNSHVEFLSIAATRSNDPVAYVST